MKIPEYLKYSIEHEKKLIELRKKQIEGYKKRISFMKVGIDYEETLKRVPPVKSQLDYSKKRYDELKRTSTRDGVYK